MIVYKRQAFEAGINWMGKMPASLNKYFSEELESALDTGSGTGAEVGTSINLEFFFKNLL